MKIPQLDKLKQIIELHFNVEDLFQETRKRPYPQIRGIFYKLARENFHEVYVESDTGMGKDLPLTFQLLGSYCNRHHAAVIHGIKTVEDLVGTEIDLEEAYTALTNYLDSQGSIDILMVRKKSLEELMARTEDKLLRLKKIINNKTRASLAKNELHKNHDFYEEVREFLNS